MTVHIHRSAFHGKKKTESEPVAKKGKAKDKPRSAVIFRDRSDEKKPTRKAAPASPAPKKEGGDAVEMIREAMRRKRVLTFKYTDHGGAVTARTVEPYKVMRSATGDVVVYGFCLEKDGIRLFKVAAMQECSVDTYDFEPRFPLEDLLDSAKDPK